jgi:hypothetical protein
MSPFEPRLAFEHLDKLAYEIGPRLAGSRGERLAAKYIRRHLRSLGLRVSVQRFDFVGILSKMRAASIILAGAFIVTIFLPALMALAVGVVGVVLVLVLPHLLPKQGSLNIIGELKPRRPKKRVLITAHYDSAPCTRGRRLTIYLRLVLVPLVVVFLLLLVLRAASLLPAWPVVWTGLAAIFLPTCGALFIARKGQGSPGANDNASGVAVMLEAARAAAENPPPDLELNFVALSAEEQGLIGSRKFAPKLETKNTTALNLDMVGAGSHLYLVEGTGTIRRRMTPKDLNEGLKRIGKLLGVKIKSLWAPTAGFDHVPLVRRGIPATTLTSGGLRRNRLDRFFERLFKLSDTRTRLYPYIHALEDVPERVKLDNMEKAGKIILKFIEKQGSS